MARRPGAFSLLELQISLILLGLLLGGLGSMMALQSDQLRWTERHGLVAGTLATDQSRLIGVFMVSQVIDQSSLKSLAGRYHVDILGVDYQNRGTSNEILVAKLKRRDAKDTDCGLASP